MKAQPHRFLAIAVSAAVFAVGLSLSAGQAAAQPILVTCANTNFGTVILDSEFAPSGPLTFVVQGTCIVNLVITRDDVTIRTDGSIPATVTAADPSQSTIQIDGARRIVIDGLFANGFTVNGGTFGINATRGGSANIRNCQVTGASNTGIISSYNSTVSVDACSVTGNASGVAAVNTAAVAITNSTVTANTSNGIVAARNSYLRVGQDLQGTPTVRPVTVSGSGATGIVVTEGSAANVVGGSVASSGGTNIFIGRASSGQIGLGTNNLTGGMTIQNGSSNGIAVEGGNATIVFSTITGNLARGIVVSNGGSARIGVTNTNNVFGANTISNNGTDGIGVFHSSGTFIGGNTIATNTVFGINVGQGTASIVGGNTITGNGQTGVFVRAGSVLIGDPGFGPATTVNTISGNGGAPSAGNTGGIFAFQGANIQMDSATISNNTGPAVQAFEAGVIELRGTTAVTVPAAGTTAGALVQFGSTFRLRDTASIVSGTSSGIQASNDTSVNIRDATVTVQGNGPGALGVQCFISAPMTASAATLTGNLTGVTGTAGSNSGCNVF
jgi:hypothetical protein